MSQEPVFERIGNRLLECLRGEMIPAVLNQGDDIKMTHPGAETDYRFGVFLHDIEEVRPYGPSASVRLSEDTRRHPDCLLALHFLLYANRKVPFDSMSAMDEMVLLEAAIRAVHRHNLRSRVESQRQGAVIIRLGADGYHRPGGALLQ